MTFLMPAGIVLVACASILLACRACTPLFAAIRQPRVIVELCVGIAVGMLLAKLFGGTQQIATVRTGLYWISAPALFIYMYCIGYESDLTAFKSGLRDSSRVAIAGLVVPFGATYAALTLHLAPAFASGSTLGELAISGAVSATAFPVLLRILDETKRLGTRLGGIVLSAAGLDDIFSWTLLGVLTLLVQHSGGVSNLFARLVAAVVCLFGAYACRLLVKQQPSLVLTVIASAGIVILALAASLLTGIDPIVASFGAGLFTPASAIGSRLTAHLQHIATKALPLFFGLSGMNVDVSGWWGALPAVAFWTVLASITKAGASFFAALASRFSSPDSVAIAALMNCRGLVGLIFLALARHNGLIDPSMYSILVIAALATTLMSTPIVEWAGGTGWQSLKGRSASP